MGGQGHALQGPQGAWVSAVQKTDSARAGLQGSPPCQLRTLGQKFLEVTSRCVQTRGPSCSAALLCPASVRQIRQTDADWHISGARLESAPSTVHVATVHDGPCGFKEHTQKEHDCQLGGRVSVLPGWHFSARACRGCGARTSRCSFQRGGCDDRETALPAPAVGLLGLL